MSKYCWCPILRALSSLNRKGFTCIFVRIILQQKYFAFHAKRDITALLPQFNRGEESSKIHEIWLVVLLLVILNGFHSSSTKLFFSPPLTPNRISDFSRRLGIFSLSHARDKTKNIFPSKLLIRTSLHIVCSRVVFQCCHSMLKNNYPSKGK